MLGSILNAINPILKETTISLTFPNAMMQKEVGKQQTHILNYLREKLQNYDLSFNLLLDEKQEKSYAYTPEEKYEKLLEINPILKDLRKEFFLDL